MDVELEEVEERVGDEVDGAVNFPFRAVMEFERSAGFVADGKGDPLDLMFLVFDMLARFATTAQLAIFLHHSPPRQTLHLGGKTYELRFMHSTWMGAP